MPKNLVIVESPSKSKTIEKYLGSEYKVVSSSRFRILKDDWEKIEIRKIGLMMKP